MHASRKLYPGGDPIDYIQASEECWEEGQKSREEILGGIRPHLADTNSATLERFLFGNGTTGMPREPYFAGWILVADLLERGVTCGELARIQPDEVPSFVDEAIEQIIN